MLVHQSFSRKEWTNWASFDGETSVLGGSTGPGQKASDDSFRLEKGPTTLVILSPYKNFASKSPPKFWHACPSCK